jgi:hypothetical protein
LPSMLVDYYLKKNLAFETEIGAKWIRSTDATGIHSTTKSLFLTVGLRSEFSADGMYRCAGMLAPCSGLLLGAPNGQPNHDAVYYGDSALSATAGPVTSAFVVETGVRYWYSRGNTRYDYFADDTNTMRVSRLAYPNLDAHAGEMFARVDARSGIIRNMFVKGHIGGGGIEGGKLYDEDFLSARGGYSKTRSDAAGDIRYGGIDLGYNVYTDDLFRLGAFVGFHTWAESIDARGCAQMSSDPICLASIPKSVRFVTEKDRWNSFRVGAVVDVNLTERLKWNGEIGLISTSQRAMDTHYFTFGHDPAKGHGDGFQAETALKYQLTEDMSVGIGMRWWHFGTRATDMYGQLLKYSIDRYGIFGQATYRTTFGNALLKK